MTLIAYARNGVYLGLGKSGDGLYALGNLLPDEVRHLTENRRALITDLQREQICREHQQLAVDVCRMLTATYDTDGITTSEWLTAHQDIDRAVRQQRPAAIRQACVAAIHLVSLQHGAKWRRI